MDFIRFICRIPHLLRWDFRRVIPYLFAACSASANACVFVHVAEDAPGSSYRSTRAYAYVYLWRRTCFFVMQHLNAACSASVHACVQIHVAEDASGGSCRSTRACAYVYVCVQIYAYAFAYGHVRVCT